MTTKNVEGTCIKEYGKNIDIVENHNKENFKTIWIGMVHSMSVYTEMSSPSNLSQLIHSHANNKVF